MKKKIKSAFLSVTMLMDIISFHLQCSLLVTRQGMSTLSCLHQNKKGGIENNRIIVVCSLALAVALFACPVITKSFRKLLPEESKVG